MINKQYDNSIGKDKTMAKVQLISNCPDDFEFLAWLGANGITLMIISDPLFDSDGWPVVELSGTVESLKKAIDVFWGADDLYDKIV